MRFLFGNGGGNSETLSLGEVLGVSKFILDLCTNEFGGGEVGKGGGVSKLGVDGDCCKKEIVSSVSLSSTAVRKVCLAFEHTLQNQVHPKNSCNHN